MGPTMTDSLKAIHFNGRLIIIIIDFWTMWMSLHKVYFASLQNFHE